MSLGYKLMNLFSRFWVTAHASSSLSQQNAISSELREVFNLVFIGSASAVHFIAQPSLSQTVD